MLEEFSTRGVSTSLTIGQSEVISHDCDSASLEVVAVDLIAQAGRRAEVL